MHAEAFGPLRERPTRYDTAAELGECAVGGPVMAVEVGHVRLEADRRLRAVLPPPPQLGGQRLLTPVHVEQQPGAGPPGRGERQAALRRVGEDRVTGRLGGHRALRAATLVHGVEGDAVEPEHAPRVGTGAYLQRVGALTQQVARDREHVVLRQVTAAGHGEPLHEGLPVHQDVDRGVPRRPAQLGDQRGHLQRRLGDPLLVVDLEVQLGARVGAHHQVRRGLVAVAVPDPRVGHTGRRGGEVCERRLHGGLLMARHARVGGQWICGRR